MTHPSLILDARMAGFSGIGTYLQGLLAGLRELAPIGPAMELLGDPDKLPPGPWTARACSAPIYSLREQVEIPWRMRAGRCRILHSPHYNLPVVAASQTIVTIHDVIHLKFPEFWPSKIAQAYAKFFFRTVLPRARAILTVSQNTKRDLMEMCGIPEDRITVTPLAVDHARYRPGKAASAEFNRLGLPAGYLLYVGNLKSFKNVERLVEAYERLAGSRKETPVLVLVGRNFIPGFETVLSRAAGVRWIGEVSPALLPDLYLHALAFLFPSLYEGFGLPPLEAMACGTPVLCSNRGSLPEVVGDAALLVDPLSTEGLTNAIQRMVEDTALRVDLSTKGLAQAARFSWKRMAEQTMEVYNQCLR